MYNTQERYLFDTSCYFVISQQFLFASIVAFCNNKWPQVKNVTNIYNFPLRWHSNGPLRKHSLSSVGLKGHVCRL